MPNAYPMYGDNPAVQRGGQVDYKRLFFSDPEIALLLNKGLHPGYGIVNEGTILAKSTANGMLVPCPRTTWVAGVPEAPFAFLTADHVAESTTCVVALADAYKFKVGDSLVLRHTISSPVYLDAGAITAISYGVSTATITFTTASAALAAFTVANSANCYIKSKATSPFKAAYGICSQAVDTGTGSAATGAGAGVLMGNAILYLAALEYYDSDALAALSDSIVDGQFFIFK